MDDLISRQAVIDLLKKSASRDIEEVVVTEKNIKLIMDVPKAYDVDAVIEQLKEESYFVIPRGKSASYCADTVIDIGDAIDIVKAGGING